MVCEYVKRLYLNPEFTLRQPRGSNWAKGIPKVTYSQGQKSSYDCPFPYETAFFQEGVVEGNSAAMPLSFRIQIKLDQTFKMRYTMSQKSNWF